MAVLDCKGPKVIGHTCSVPSIAKSSSVTSKSNMQMASTYLKCDARNTTNSLCNRVQLIGVNTLLVLCEYGTTDLCEDGAIFDCPVDKCLYRSTHQWGVFLQQSFEFME